MNPVASVHEEVLVFGSAGEHLLGIVSRPAGPPAGQAAQAAQTGVLIVVGGPQYRAGSHRQFVLWARALAGAGVPTVRFDVRGMGDAGGDQRPFTALSPDIGAAVDAMLQALPGLQRVVLCGLCDGASAALLYLHERPDPRIAGLVLLNPWVRSDETLSRTIVKHYYLQRLTDRGFWSKLLRGQVALRALRELAGHLTALWRPRPGAASTDAPARFQDRMAAALEHGGLPVLLAISSEDYTAKEFLEHARSDAAWVRALAQARVERLDIAGADHTVSDTTHRQQLEAASIAWLRSQGFR